MKTAVVILNWNTRDYLRRWLPALIGSCRGMDAGVVVADNASGDGSVEMLAQEFPSTRVIALDANYGFTGGYNRALAQVEAEYFVLVNSDVEVADGWLEPLVTWMDTHGDCGVCGPKLHALEARDGEYVRSDRFEYAGAAGGLIDRYGFPYCRGRVLSHTETDRGQYDHRQEPLLWISGACMMTRSSLWKRLGGLDESFFAHMEEIDYCWRVQLAGYRVESVPESMVWHLGGGTLPQGSPLKLKLNFRNNRILLEKNLPATVGPATARRRIAFRSLLDRLYALACLLTGHRDEYLAIREARREAVLMMARAVRSEAVAGAHVYGYRNLLIFLRLKHICRF